ncbi:hypothetical protein V8E36_009329 [Tilletia maclaganii]
METSSEFLLATRIVATAGKAIISTPSGMIDPLVMANQSVPGIARSVPQLLYMAKRHVPPMANLVFVIITLVLTICILILAVFDALRGFSTMRRRKETERQMGGLVAASHSRRGNRAGQDMHLLEEEDAPRLLGAGWRPFYALFVAIASICQMVYLLIYLQTSRGLAAQETLFSSSNAAFVSSIVAGLFLIFAAIPSSPASRLRLGNTASPARSAAWYFLIVALVALGPALAILLMAIGSIRYTKALQPLNSALTTLLARPAFCATGRGGVGGGASSINDASNPCSVYSIAFLLQDEATAAKTNIAFKGVVLLCVAILTALVAHEALRALRYRQAALTDVHMQLEQARLENEDLGFFRSGGSSSSSSGGSEAGSSEKSGYGPSLAGSRQGSLFRSGMSAQAERNYIRYLQGLGFHSLYRRDTVWSESSAGSGSSAPTYKSGNSSSSDSKRDPRKPVRKPPPSYRDLASRSSNLSELDELDTRGVDLDTTYVIGRALQRQYGCVDVKRGVTTKSKSSSKSSDAKKDGADERRKAQKDADDDDDDEDHPRLPGYLNAHITKPEAAAVASRGELDRANDTREEKDDGSSSGGSRRVGLSRSKSTVRVEHLARARSLKIDEIDASKIVPALSSCSSSSGDEAGRRSNRPARPRGGRPLGGSSYSSTSSAGDPYDCPSSRSSSRSKGTESSYARWNRAAQRQTRSRYGSYDEQDEDDYYSRRRGGGRSRPTSSYLSHQRSYSTLRGGGAASLYSSSSAAAAYHQHPGSIALTLSAAAASSTAALARTAPLRSRMRANRALALATLATFVLLLIVRLTVADELELGNRALVEIVLSGGGWVVEMGSHAGVLGVLMLRGSGAVEDLTLSWPGAKVGEGGGGSGAETRGSVDEVDLEAGRRGSKSRR